MDLLIVGSAALDSIETPFGKKDNILGGSAVHASIAAGFFSKVGLVSVVGEDFPEENIKHLERHNIDTAGLEITPDGKTFRWTGYYEYDMNQAHTKDTQLNVLSTFSPKVPQEWQNAEYVFLANLDPDAQLKVIEQLKNPKVLACDTMNFWIESKREQLHKVLKAVDFVLMNEGEARQFMETPSLPIAAKRMLEHGCRTVIIKKGEHGALLFNNDFHFSAPSYPQEVLRDPTGAGDSFAGGFMGYLAKTKDLSEENIRKALIIGSVMASYNIEDFSMERMKSLKKKEIFERFEEFSTFSKFEPLSLAHIS